MPRGLELDIGLAGLALLRNWLVGDAETADRLLAEVRSLAVDGHPRAAPFSVPERDVDDAYYEWAPDYDSPRNPVFPAEAPAMLDLLRGIRTARHSTRPVAPAANRFCSWVSAIP